MQARKFADFWRGVFFLVSTISLIILMWMFIFIWQPVWTAGFKDFHTISGSISKLNETTKPTAEAAPLLLVEISKMNESLRHIKSTMLVIGEMNKSMSSIGTSMKTIEEINPNIVSMNYTMAQMNHTMLSQMRQMNYEVDQMGNKLSPLGMMPFNW